MPKASIPPEIQSEVHKLIDEFNRENPKESTSLLNAFFPSKKKRGYSARFKGKFLYGEEFVDGTLTGAMKAGMVAYEVR